MPFNTRKIISLLLTASMFLSLISTSTFAEEIAETQAAEAIDIIEINEEVIEETNEDPVSAELSDEINTELIPESGVGVETVKETAYDIKAELMADSAQVTYPIEKGQTFSFENIDIVAHDITGLTQKIDYVIYYKDGSINSYYSYAKPTTLSVPAGGKIIITSLEYTINAVLADDYFIVEQQETPVFTTKLLNLYDSYTFTNTTKVTYTVISLYTGSDYSFDYTINDTEGLPYNRAENVYGKIDVPAGFTLKITQTGPYTQVIKALSDKFSVAKCNTPAMRKVKLTVGETYVYTNKNTIAANIRYRYSGSDHAFDYVLYDENSNIVNYNANVYQNIEVPAGYSLKVTQTGPYGQELNGWYEFFDLVKVDEPVMHKINLSPGETYIFTNKSSAVYNVYNRYSGASNYGYDLIFYDADGNITATYINNCNYSVVEPGESLKVTQTGPYGQELNALYDVFDVAAGSEPAMHKTYLYPGETYTYKNISNEPYTIKYRYSGASNYGFNYVLYYSDGKAKETGSKVTQNIQIPAGGSAKITQVGVYGQELNAPTEVFEVYNNTTEKKSYKLTNITTVDTTFSTKSGYSCDYSVYDANNSLYNYNINATGDIKIPKGGYALVTANSNSTSPFNDNSDISIEEYGEPVYNTTYLIPGETYKFTNNGPRELYVFKNGLACDFSIHNADGTIDSSSSNDTDDKFGVPIGGSICISAQNYIHVKGLDKYFDVEYVDEPTHKRIFCNRGETYQFTNTSAVDYNLGISKCIYDYVIYNADGSLYTSGYNVTDERIAVPSGNKCVVTIISSNATIIPFSESFTSIYKRNYPVFTRIPVYFGTPVTITNTDDVQHSVNQIAANYIDYTTYDSGNNVQESKQYVNTTKTIVPPNGKIEISSRGSNTTLIGFYQYFSDEDLSVKVTGVTLSSNSLTLEKGKQSVLKATVLPEDATNKGIIWSSSNPSVATVAQTGKVTAKAYGTAVITVTTSDGGYTATCTVTVNDGTVSVTIGDVNGDGEIDFVDAITVLKHDAGISSISGDKLTAADVNGDGDVDFVDAIQILKFDSGLISSFK